MDNKQLILESFTNMDEALNSIQQLKWTGRDISGLSIAIRDRGTHLKTVKNPSKGDMIEIGSLDIPISGIKPLKLNKALFFSQEIGGVMLAGPLSEWALNDFMANDNPGGLRALRSGLIDLGADAEEIEYCISAVKRGKVLIVIPDPAISASEKNEGKQDSTIRISDMAKYE